MSDPTIPVDPGTTVQRLRSRIVALEKENRELKRALNQHGHTVHFDEDGWSSEHPVECRSIPGMNCQVGQALRGLPYAPLPYGDYPVEVDNNGELVFTLATDTEVKAVHVTPKEWGND
jgi:hypothetical protein